MPYLIDGHNLIGQMPGMSLADLDDEQKLIGLLQVFCRKRQKDVEVFFDQAPAGQARQKRYGRLVAHFVSRRTTADAAIGKRLQQLGGEASNWTVVSSDHVVQNSARHYHAQVISSATFARQLRAVQEAPEPGAKGGRGEGEKMDPRQVDEWMDIFGLADDE